MIQQVRERLGGEGGREASKGKRREEEGEKGGRQAREEEEEMGVECDVMAYLLSQW